MAGAKAALPRLEEGDEMDRAEFHRRYELRPDIDRAELIEGAVVIASPERFGFHNRQTVLIGLWLGTYSARHPEVEAGGSASLFLDDRNEYRADGFLFFRERERSTARWREDDYIDGAPDLVVEVAGSSAARDLGPKFQVYQRNGAREYIVWRVEDGALDWFVLEEGRYRRQEPGPGGIIESTTFPGLRMDVAAMLAGDKRKVLAALQ